MGKLHVLFKKEEIDSEKMDHQVAVIIDVLLATSVVAAALYHGAKEVIPVLNGKEALQLAEEKEKGTYLLIGEYQGVTLDGFLSPSVTRLEKQVKDKTVILSTTNGTVAVRKSAPAKKVYTSSLINGAAVAKRIVERHADDTIVIVCSGSAGAFNLEDFYGAGYLIHEILQAQPRELTDAAMAALGFFQAYSTVDGGEDWLKRSRVGRMLHDQGYAHETKQAALHGVLDIVPYFQDGRIIC